MKFNFELNFNDEKHNSILKIVIQNYILFQNNFYKISCTHATKSWGQLIG